MYRDFSYIHCPHMCIASSIINTIHQNSICFYQEWSTLTHHNHPMSTVSLRIPYWCCIFYGFGQMCIYPYIHHLIYVEYSHYSKNPVLCLFIFPPSTLPSNHRSFRCLHSLAFSTCHIVGILQYISFSACLLSLSNMHLRFLQVFLCRSGSFLFSAE